MTGHTNGTGTIIRKGCLAILGLAPALFTSCDKPARQSVEISTPEEVEARKKTLPGHADAEFKDQMTEKVFQDYLRLRTALVRSDPSEAGAAAEDIAESLGAKQSEANRIAARIAESEDLNEQRTGFSQLTVELRPLFEKGLSGGKIHVLHCPMAFDNKGADWISDSDKILNPYFGNAMPECGELRETLTPPER